MTDYSVTLTLRVTTKVTFASGTPTLADAIDNAIGGLPDSLLQWFDDQGYDLALPIDGEASVI